MIDQTRVLLFLQKVKIFNDMVVDHIEVRRFSVGGSAVVHELDLAIKHALYDLYVVLVTRLMWEARHDSHQRTQQIAI